ncbi:MAG: gas vesicle protein GvpJ [Methanobacterium sp.]
MASLKPSQSLGLLETLDLILDKGIVIDGEVRASLGGQDLLGINTLIVLASIETGARIGLDFPSGTDYEAPGWQDLITKEDCPLCGKKLPREKLEEEGCSWCGWNYRPKYEDRDTFDER